LQVDLVRLDRAVPAARCVGSRLVESGYKPGGAPPAAFATFVRTETNKYGKIINTIGLEKN
jgi:hypothetical protein